MSEYGTITNEETFEGFELKGIPVIGCPTRLEKLHLCFALAQMADDSEETRYYLRAATFVGLGLPIKDVKRALSQAKKAADKMLAAEKAFDEGTGPSPWMTAEEEKWRKEGGPRPARF